MQAEPLLKVRNISKAFPAVQALDDVSLDFYPGSVHAVIGENGAGKSTLMKIISGAYEQDEGTLILDGEPLDLRNPTDAIAQGISMVYQELSVFPAGTVAENIYPSRLPARGLLRLLDRTTLNSNAREVLEPFGLSLDLNRPLRDLSFSERQMTEICKAISLSAKVFLLDEPTSALTSGEIEILFETIRRLKSQGAAVVYISHRIPEIMEIADEITVLRDGKLIATVPRDEASPDELVRMMVGRTIETFYPDHEAPPVDPLLDVRHLSSDVLDDVSFSVSRGEILGIAGLVGSGRTELLLSLFGMDRSTTGEVLLAGEPITVDSARDAMRLGFGLSPEDRRSQGLFLNLNVGNNILVTVFDRLSRFGFIRRRAADQEANEYVDQLSVRTAGIGELVVNLSGGNQQKTVLARWLAIKPRVLLLDEPTAGVDAGAKHELYGILVELASRGVAIIMVSSELPELLGLCDRIGVLHAGRMETILPRDEATEENLLAHAAGLGGNSNGHNGNGHELGFKGE